MAEDGTGTGGCGPADGPPLLNCPSALPSTPGSVAFGVVGGSVEEPRLRYLSEQVPVSDELLDKAGPVDPAQVFRFTAPCAGSACQHFDGSNCSLIDRVVTLLPPVIERLPPCTVRPTCRWWHQHGSSACHRCPQVVTVTEDPSDPLRAAAEPPSPRGADAR